MATNYFTGFGTTSTPETNSNSTNYFTGFKSTQDMGEEDSVFAKAKRSVTSAVEGIPGMEQVWGFGEGVISALAGMATFTAKSTAALPSVVETGHLSGQNYFFDPKLNLDTYKKVSEHLDKYVAPVDEFFAPTSDSGQSVQNFIGKVFSLPGELGIFLGDTAQDAGTSAKTATAIRMIPEALLSIMGPKTFKNILEKARSAELPDARPTGFKVQRSGTNAIFDILNKPVEFGSAKGEPAPLYDSLSKKTFTDLQKLRYPTLDDITAERLYNDYASTEFLRAYQNPLLELDPRFKELTFAGGKKATFTKDGVTINLGDSEFTLLPNEFTIEMIRGLNQSELAQSKFRTTAQTRWGDEQDYVAFVGSRFPEEVRPKIVNFKDAVNHALDLRQQELAKRKLHEESLMWEQKAFEELKQKAEQEKRAYAQGQAGWTKKYHKIDKDYVFTREDVKESVLQSERELDNLLRASSNSINRIAQRDFSRGKFGKQRGSVDPDLLFAPFLAARRAFKGLSDFTETVLGGQNQSAASLLFDEYNSRLSKMPNSIMPDARVLETAVANGLLTSAEAKELNKNYKATISGAHKSLDRTLMELIGTRAQINNIREISYISPTARYLADSFHPPEMFDGPSTAKGGATFSVAKQLKFAEFTNRLNDALHPYKNTAKGVILGKLKKADNDRIVAALRGEKVNLSKADQATVDNVRALLNDLYKYAEEVLGKDYMDKYAPYQDKYFPRHYDVTQIEPFAEAIKDYVGGIEQAREIARKVASGDRSFVYHSPWMLKLGTDPKTHMMSRSRSIDHNRLLSQVPDEVLKPWLRNDVENVLSSYIDSVTNRIEMARKFGKDGEILDQLIQRMANELEAKGMPLEMWRAQSVYDLINQYQRTYRRAEVNPTINKIQGGMTSLTNFALLSSGLTTLASLPEVLMPLSRAGVSAYAKAVFSSLPNIARWGGRKVGIKFKPTMVEQVGRDLGLAYETVFYDRLAQIANGELGGALDSITFRMNLLTAFTKGTQYFALDVFRNQWVNYLKDLSKNPTAREPMVQAWSDRYSMPLDEALAWYRSGMSTNHPFYSKFKIGAQNFIRENVLHAEPANTATWQNNPHIRILSHLTKYPYMMGTQFTGRILNEAINVANKFRKHKSIQNAGAFTDHIVKSAAAVGAILMAQKVLQDWKDENITAPGQPHLTNEHRWMNAMDKSGILGGPGQLVADTQNFGFQKVLLGRLFGVSGQQVMDLVEGVDAAREGSNARLARKLAKLTPIAGKHRPTQDKIAEYLRGVIPEGEKEASQSSGVYGGVYGGP